MSPDPETGASYFDFDLRHSFLMFDEDCDGFIDINEFAEFLKHDCMNLTAGATSEELEAMHPIFLKKAKEMKKQLCMDSEEHTDHHREVISWNEFKVFRLKCK